jgi:hypothetical protein
MPAPIPITPIPITAIPITAIQTITVAPFRAPAVTVEMPLMSPAVPVAAFVARLRECHGRVGCQKQQIQGEDRAFSHFALPIAVVVAQAGDHP